MTAQTPTTPGADSSSDSTVTAGTLIAPVLAELADVVAAVEPEQFGRPTPCTEFDVAALRRHILGWVDYFGLAFTDPHGDGDRPDPTASAAPDDPAAAAGVVQAAAGKIAQAVAGGVADRPVLMVAATMPGESLLRMTLWEYVTHGSDLARATGQPWNPPAAAIQDALTFAPMMLTDEYRGPGKSFGARVPIEDGAPPLDRLLAFTGRTPTWTP